MPDEEFLWFGSATSARAHVERQAQLHDRWNSDPQLRSSYDEQEPRRFGAYEGFIKVYGNVAVVDVTGTLDYKETDWSLYFNEMTYESLAGILATLVTDGGVKNVVLDIDSPGGAVRGISVASDAIKATREAGLNVIAHTSGMMCSAAYWLGVSADETLSAKAGEVGSVGVVAVHREITGMLDQMGIKVTVFRKGEEKALGSPYEALTDKARASIDRGLENAYTAFIDHVAAERNLSSDVVRSTIATGRVFTATEALQLGMIDKIQTFNSLVNELTAPTASNYPTGVIAMSKTPILAATPAALNPDDLDPEVLAAAAATGVLNEPDPKAEEPEPKEPAPEPAPEPDAAKAAQLFSEALMSLTAQLVEARVSLEKATAERDDLRAANTGLRQIVVDQTAQLRIKLGQPAGADLAGMSDGALVAAHQATKADFMARFTPGAVSKVPQKDAPLPTAAVTRITKAVQSATSFGK